MNHTEKKNKYLLLIFALFLLLPASALCQTNTNQAPSVGTVENLSTLKQYWFPIASYEEVGTPISRPGAECESVVTFATDDTPLSCAALPSTNAPIVKLSNGGALTSGTAKLSYAFTVPAAGSYDFKIKVSNDADNFSKLSREQIDYILANDANHDNVSYQIDSANGNLTVMEYSDYAGSLASNAKYNTFRSMIFSVYIDGEDVQHRKGFIVVKNTDPSQLQESSVALGSLETGQHTVYLHFLSDYYFEYQSGALPSGFKNFATTDLNKGRCLGGAKAGAECSIDNDCPESACQKSLDTNPVIYSVAINTVQPSLDVIGILVFPNPKSLDPLTWYNENTITPSADVEQITVDGYRAVRDDHTVYVDAANIDANDSFYTNIYVIAYNLGAPAPTVAIFNQMLDNWVFNTNVIALDPLVGETAKDKLRRDTIRKSDLYNIQQLLEKYKAANSGKYPAFEAGTYIKDHTISTWPSWQATLGNKLGSGLPVDPLNIMTIDNREPYDCNNPVEKANCQSICSRDEGGNPLTGCPSNQQCVGNQYCSMCEPGYDAQTCWDKVATKFAFPDIFSGCDLPRTNIYNGALKLGASTCTLGKTDTVPSKPYSFDGAYVYQYTAKDNGTTYLLNYRLEYKAPVCSADQCSFEGTCYQAGSCLYNPLNEVTPIYPNYKNTQCFLGRWDNSCNNGIVQTECGEECDPGAPTDTLSSYCDVKFGSHDWYNEANINASCTDQCVYTAPSGTVEAYTKDPTLLNCGGFCGDKILQSEYKESCDQGPGGIVPTPDQIVGRINGVEVRGAGGTSQSLQYRCSATCQPDGGFCGDGLLQSEFEQCDKANYITPTPQETTEAVEGAKPQYACGKISSGKDCQFSGGFCGDGTVQDKYGEVCDDKVGIACSIDSDCPAKTCSNTCAGGDNADKPCAGSSDCPKGSCTPAKRVCTSKNCNQYCKGTYCGNGVVESPNSKGVNEVCDWASDPLCSQDCQHIKMGGTCTDSVYNHNCIGGANNGKGCSTNADCPGGTCSTPCNPQTNPDTCKLCDKNLSCSVRNFGDLDLKCLGTRGSFGCTRNDDCISGYYCDSQTTKCEMEASTYLTYRAQDILRLYFPGVPRIYIDTNPSICPKLEIVALSQDKSAVFDLCSGLSWDSADKISKDQWKYTDAQNACTGIFKLPTIAELYSLVSQTNLGTGIDFKEQANALKLCGLRCGYNPKDPATLCINCGDDNYIYWSSTCSQKTGTTCNKALAVNFKYGSVEEYDVSEGLKVHCKREAQCGNGTIEEGENCEFYVDANGKLLEQNIATKCTDQGYDGGFVHCDPISCIRRYDNCYLNSVLGQNCGTICQNKKKLACKSIGLNNDKDRFEITETGSVIAQTADNQLLYTKDVNNCVTNYTEAGQGGCDRVFNQIGDGKCNISGSLAPFLAEYSYCNCDEIFSAESCVPNTCDELEVGCGATPNGCGGTIANCGNCPGGNCEAGKCIACTPSCSSGARCTGNNLEECITEAQNSCLHWVQTKTCAADRDCSATLKTCVKKCPDSCTVGVSQCDGTNAYKTCVAPLDPINNCPDWSVSSTCPTGQTCQDGACKCPTAICTKDATRCSGNDLEKCIEDAANGICAHWITEPACSGGQTCQSGACACATGYKDCSGTCILDANCCNADDCSAISGQICKLDGSCDCSAGYKVCGTSCIPTANCCTSAECTAISGQTCQSGVCACSLGNKVCGTSCIPTANCCTNADCAVDQTCNTTTKQCVSSAKAITAFTIPSQVGTTTINESAKTIAVTMPPGTNVTLLTPTITISAGASVNPASGTAQNFTSPKSYIVTAADGSTQAYTVTVTVMVGTAITITNTTTEALTDYQVKFTLAYTSSIPTQLNITNQSGTKIPYYIDTTVTTNPRPVYVKVPSIPAKVAGTNGTATIYVAKPITGSSLASDGPGTFDLFQDFSTGGIGNLTLLGGQDNCPPGGSYSCWGMYTLPSGAQGYPCNADVNGASYYEKIAGRTQGTIFPNANYDCSLRQSVALGLHSEQTFSDNFRVTSKLLVPGGNSYTGWFAVAGLGKTYLALYNGGSRFGFLDSGSWSNISGTGGKTYTDYMTNYVKIDETFDNGLIKFYINDSYVYQKNWGTGTYPNQLHFGFSPSATVAGFEARFDDIRVSKFVTSEPTANPASVTYSTLP